MENKNITKFVYNVDRVIICFLANTFKSNIKYRFSWIFST